MKRVAIRAAAVAAQTTMSIPESKSRRSSEENAMRKVRRKRGSRPRRIVVLRVEQLSRRREVPVVTDREGR